MSELDSKTKEMIAIGASIAGNCIPCLRYHFKEAVKQGCTKQEIREVFEISNIVKQRPINEINKLFIQLLENKE